MPKFPKTRVTNRVSTGCGILVLIGSSLIMTGLFLPWYEVMFEDGEVMTINGLGWYSQIIRLLPGLELNQLHWVENLWTLGFAILIMLLVVIQFFWNFRWLSLVLFAVSLLCARQLFIVFDFDSHLPGIGFWDEGPFLISLSVSSQPTLVISYLGSLLALIGSIIGLFQNKSRTTPYR